MLKRKSHFMFQVTIGFTILVLSQDVTQRTFEEALMSLGGKRFILIADWVESPIFGTKAQGHLAQSMMLFKEYNGYKVVEIVPKALVRIGLKEAAAETGEDDFRIVVATHAEAQEVLERLKLEL